MLSLTYYLSTLNFITIPIVQINSITSHLLILLIACTDKNSDFGGKSCQKTPNFRKSHFFVFHSYFGTPMAPLSLLGSFELRSSVVSVLPRVTPGTPPSWRVYVLTWFLEQGVKPGFIQITPRVPSVLQYLWVCAHISHTFSVFLFLIYDIIFVNNDALTCISAFKRSCDFCCPISPLYAGTEFQA